MSDNFSHFFAKLLFDRYLYQFCDTNPIIRTKFFSSLCYVLRSIVHGQNKPEDTSKYDEIYMRAFATIPDRKFVHDLFALLFIGSLDKEHVVSTQAIDIWKSSVLKIAKFLNETIDSFPQFFKMMIKVNKFLSSKINLVFCLKLGSKIVKIRVER